MKLGYTPEQVEWLRSHCSALSLRELTDQYNATFGQTRTPSAIKSTVAEVAREVIATAKVEVDFIRATGQNTTTDFFPRPSLPGIENKSRALGKS